MVIKLDIDGVIRDIYSMMCGRYNRVFGTRHTVNDIISYGVNDSFPLVKESLGVDGVEWFFGGEFGKTLFENAKPYEGAKEAVDKLMELGHKVVICTYQKSTDNKVSTLNFLDKNGIRYDDIFFTHDKWLIDGDVMIDDCGDFLEDEREGSKVKIKINQAFNNDVRCDYSFNTLKDAVNSIEKWA